LPGAVDESTPEYKQALGKYKTQCDAEKQEVLAAGGLHILGTERHESRRIDNQLRGRAGRQSDPGSSRFFLSLEDDLMRIFGAERITGLMERLGMEEDVPIEHPLINRAIENAQKKVEGHNFDIRKNLLEYDDVMNQQRKTIYALRRQVLEGRYAPELSAEEKKAGKVAPVPTTSGRHTAESLAGAVRPTLARMLEAEFQLPFFLYLSRYFLLEEIDQRWIEHLKSMEALREGIGLRGYGQKDPKQEYKKEGFVVFGEMMTNISRNVAEKLFHVQVR